MKFATIIFSLFLVSSSSAEADHRASDADAARKRKLGGKSAQRMLEEEDPAPSGSGTETALFEPTP